MIQRCVQGKSLDRHKHHGFWTRSIALTRGAKEVARAVSIRVLCKAGLAEAVGDEGKNGKSQQKYD
jgi:hypothetical protein